jgi:hypothetical protein
MKTKYEELKEKLINPKAIETLDRIEESINVLEKEQILFNVASIGRYCEDKWESPKTQSIRNNKDLMEYIKHRQNLIKLKNKESKNKNNGNVYGLDKKIMDSIENENIKTYLKIQEERYKLLEQQYFNLKKVISDISPVNIDKLIEDNLDIKNPIDLVSNLKFDTKFDKSNNSFNNLLNETLKVDDNTDKTIDIYFNNKNKDNPKNIIQLVDENNITKLEKENIENFLKVLNEKFLSKLDIELSISNNKSKIIVINKITGSIIYDFKK